MYISILGPDLLFGVWGVGHWGAGLLVVVLLDRQSMYTITAQSLEHEPERPLLGGSCVVKGRVKSRPARVQTYSSGTCKSTKNCPWIFKYLTYFRGPGRN